jgi:hypothetical protein
MKKLIHHRWEKADGFRRHICKICGCSRFWDEGWQKMIYFSKNKFYYFTIPECDLPNTKH